MAGVKVHGLQNLNRALAQADKDVRLGIRAEYRSVAEPVRADAERLAEPRLKPGRVAWNQMRIGITQRAVYVVPKQRGARKNQAARRPNAATRIFPAMQQALDQNAPEIERRFNRMLHGVADKFNR